MALARQPGAILIPMAAGCRACCTSARLGRPLQTLCSRAAGASWLCCRAAAGCGLGPRPVQGRDEAAALCWLCSWRAGQAATWLPMQGWEGALPQSLPRQTRSASLPCPQLCCCLLRWQSTDCEPCGLAALPACCCIVLVAATPGSADSCRQQRQQRQTGWLQDLNLPSQHSRYSEQELPSSCGFSTV